MIPKKQLSKMPEIDTAGAVEVPPAGSSTAQMWSRCFKKWTHDESKAEPSPPTLMGHNWKSCVLRKAPVGHKLDRVEAAAKKSIRTSIELTRRSFTSLFRNPVVLGFRIAVYTAMVSSQIFAYCNYRFAYSLKLCHVTMLVNHDRDHFFSGAWKIRLSE